MTRLRLAPLIAFLFVPGTVLSQDFDPENVLIENVYLATESANGSPINLLIRDNKLALISQDRIPLPDGFAALDGDGGFVFGNLTTGEPPDFIILATDPREDMIALMDTKGLATYMVYQGKLRKSTLEVRASDVDHIIENPTWNAYTPPPVSLPISRDAGASWNHWDTEHTKNVFFTILAIDRQAWLSQDSASEEQVGSLDLFEGGEIRDVRMGIFGTLNFFDRPWGYNISFSSNAFDKEFEEGRLTSFNAIDYRLDIPIGDSLSLSLGKQKEPISMERTMSLVNLPMQERSAPAAFLPGRSFGAQLSGNALAGRLSWAAGAFNNFIDEDAAFSEATSSVSGRVTWAALLSEDRSNVLHLAIAGRVLDDGPPIRFSTKPEFDKSPVFVDTDILETNRVEQISLESSWRRGPFWLAAEHLTSIVETPGEGRLSFSGYYVMASWIVTGEMRAFQQRNGTFGAVPVAQPTSTNGPGAWELALRWSDIDLDDGPIQGGDMNVLSLGTTWWWTSTSNLSLNYRYVVNDRGGLTGESNGANLRLLLKLN